MPKFTAQIKKFNGQTEDNMNKVFRRVSLDILRRLIIRSPVDTGRFRGNWQTGLNNTPEGSVAKFDKNGVNTINAESESIEEAKIGDSIFIVNNLPYAVRLENGWSQQAPAGMVGVTVAEYPSIVKAAVDAYK